MKDDRDWYYWESQLRQIMRSPRFEHDDLVRGRCSGIPECCITFFIETWMMDLDITFKHKERMDEVRGDPIRFRYVPCPDCLVAQRFVEIRHCDGPSCFCGQWEHREMVQEKLRKIEPTAFRAYRKWRRISKSKRKQRRGYA